MDMWLGYLQLILDGAVVTIQLTIYGCILAFAVAIVVGLGRVSRFAPVRWLAVVYVEFFRGTSIFVQMFWFYYVLPLMGFTLTPLQAGVMSLGLNVGAYGAEVVRSAVQSVDRGQREASLAVNLTRTQTMRHIILPQAIVVMLPTFGNNAIELLKGTAIVSLISLSDMTFQAQVVRSQTGDTAIPFITILILYFAIASVISFGIRSLERHMSKGMRA